MYKLWCEYEYAQDSIVFTTEKAVQDWFNEIFFKVETDTNGNFDYEYWGFDKNKTPYQNMSDQGLISLMKLDVIGPRNAVPVAPILALKSLAVNRKNKKYMLDLERSGPYIEEERNRNGY